MFFLFLFHVSIFLTLSFAFFFIPSCFPPPLSITPSCSLFSLFFFQTFFSFKIALNSSLGYFAIESFNKLSVIRLESHLASPISICTANDKNLFLCNILLKLSPNHLSSDLRKKKKACSHSRAQNVKNVSCNISIFSFGWVKTYRKITTHLFIVTIAGIKIRIYSKVFFSSHNISTPQYSF